MEMLAEPNVKKDLFHLLALLSKTCYSLLQTNFMVVLCFASISTVL